MVFRFTASRAEPLSQKQDISLLFFSILLEVTA